MANFGDGTVSILLGGGGGFALPVTYATGANPMSVAVGDFNGDGAPDLVVANNGRGTASVLLGKGDGTFGPQVTYPGSTNPDSVAAGDFNGDGISILRWPTVCSTRCGSCWGIRTAPFSRR